MDIKTIELKKKVNQKILQMINDPIYKSEYEVAIYNYLIANNIDFNNINKTDYSKIYNLFTNTNNDYYTENIINIIINNIIITEEGLLFCKFLLDE